MKICGSKGYGTTEDMNFFCLAFSVDLDMKTVNKLKDTSIPHWKSKIWYHLIVGWVPIFWEVRGKSIGGDLDVDDEGSEQRWFKPVQSLHHSSVGYQPTRTWIGLTKKAISLQVNREHKQK
jgi:hypothetical protein